MTTTSNPYRLARTYVPSAYRLFLTPDLSAFTFSGRVEIDLEVTESLNELTLHALELELGATTLTSGGVSLLASAVSYDDTYETATLRFEEALPTGPAVLEIAFTGTLNDQLHGFYRSTYEDADGVTHVIATTQFEHSDARRAFPCFDEPSFKATYQVNLTVPRDLAAYSNSPVASDVDLGNGQRTVSFTPTMKMSTYLVAFVVGPFEETAALDVDGVPLRVISPRGKGHLSALALEAGAFALRWFSQYFEIPYPGDKLDMVAVPDFAAGAMENLGLVTYRENALLVDPATASLTEIQRVAEVVHHEIAHMWFGDLVTMEWWEGIWLNEAFATFMQLLCTNAMRPEWKTWVDQAAFRDMALNVDGLASTRPIEYEVISPYDTQGMFDVLTYEKGGSVLRMLEQYLGEETFRRGISHYLTKHSYANTVTTDLWDALEEISGQPVRELMNTWILQGGHPLVTFENGQLTQQPFVFGDPSHKGAIGDSWLVPVMTRSLNGGAPTRHLLKREPITVSDDAPVVINAGGSGVFRSRYGRAELAALAPRLGELEELERGTLVADSWAALFAGQITWADFLVVARGLGDADEPTAWGFVATAFDTAARSVRDDQRATLAGQARDLMGPQFARLGWDRRASDTELTHTLRGVLIATLGTLGADEAIQQESARRFDANNLDGDLAASILHVVASLNRPGDYEEFLRRYREAPTPQDEMRYLVALGGFNDETIALDAAAKCFSELRTQNAPIILGTLTRNEVTGPAVWRYLVSRWDEAIERFSSSHHSRLAGGIATFVKDPAFAEEVIAFHEAHPVSGGYPASVPQLIERLRVGLTFASAVREQL
ncbi:MAG TPA: M1 family metallopeptidase [Acidimicrobiales bacterium]